MTEDRSVTIVITTYNHARYLADAIDSVLAQTVEPTAIIVVDDGSKDDPGAVVARYPGVQFLRQENQGPSGARNTGLAACSTRYVAFLDADDTLRPRMIELNLGQYERTPDAGFVYGAYELVDETGALIWASGVHQPEPDAYRSFLVTNLVGMLGTVLFRRDALVAIGGFDAALRASEDYDVFLRLCRDHPVAAIDEPLANYRRHGSNSSADIAFMLSKTLDVLGRQKGHASTRPEWAAAYARGVENWKRFYAREQVLRIRDMNKAGMSRQAIASRVLKTGRIAPAALLRTVRSAVVRRAEQATPLLRLPVFFGSLSRATPIARDYGAERGPTIDRFYTERFLEANRDAIAGDVLADGSDLLARRYGGDAIGTLEVLNRYGGRRGSTVVDDLSHPAHLGAACFDCVLLTRSLHRVPGLDAAIDTIWRVLRPGGTLLVAMPWGGPLETGELGERTRWSISPTALGELLSGPFPQRDVAISTFGNVKSAVAFLHGLSWRDLEHHDPKSPVIVAARARKPEDAS
jgi:glycosyltransferase involved in cell wall biosynthesis